VYVAYLAELVTDVKVIESPRISVDAASVSVHVAVPDAPVVIGAYVVVAL
jgi:hypothetical protein